MRKIKVIICPADRMPYVTNISNTLENLQRIVGGYIETAMVFSDAVVICNEEGRLLGLPENQSLFLSGFCGNCLICGVDANGEDFTSLPEQACKELLQACRARYQKERRTFCEVKGGNSNDD